MARADIVEFDIGAGSRHPMNNANSYDAKTSRYNPDFVNPTHWVIRMDAWNGLQRYIKGNQPGFQAKQINPSELILTGLEVIGPGPIPFRLPDEVVSYEWSIRNNDGSFHEKIVNHRKNFNDGRERVVVQADFRVPKLERYTVTLAVRFRDGTVESNRKSITLRDFLVVSIGDSFSSGQGNPDQPAQTTFVGQKECQATTLSMAVDADINLMQAPEWQEPKAYRSYNSAPSYAARDLEINRKSPGDMITFLTFARSGSTIINGLVGPKDKTIDKGQIDEVKRAIGNRKIDALIISIGGNDAGFAATLENLVSGDLPSLWNLTWTDDKENRDKIIADVRFRISNLPNQFTALEGFIRMLNVSARDVYLIEYPVTLFEKMDANGDPFVDEGCGVFEGPDLDMSLADARAVTEVGLELNAAVKAAASTHSWRYVEGLFDLARGRGYCAGSDSLFVSAEESCRNQGDFEGIMHPNSKAHLLFSTLIAQKVNNLSLHPPTEKQESASNKEVIGGGLK